MISREQTAIDLPPDDAPVASLPSIQRILDAPADQHDPPPRQAQDQLAEMGDDDAEDDLDVLAGGDDFYADALSDV